MFRPPDLLEADADPNAANHLRQTPLMWAASKREYPEEILPLLVAKGAIEPAIIYVQPMISPEPEIIGLYPTRMNMFSGRDYSLEPKSSDGRSVLDWTTENANPAAVEIIKQLDGK